MKSTMWVELKAEECRVIKLDVRNGNIQSIQIKHILLPRALYFTKSQAGNWYWRATRTMSDAYADAYIIQGNLVIPDGLPLAYPEFA